MSARLYLQGYCICEKSVHNGKLWEHVRFFIYLLFDCALFYSFSDQNLIVSKKFDRSLFFFSNLESQDFLVHT